MALERIRGASVVALLGCLSFFSGCYHPNIEPGGLICADAGTSTATRCPDGFHCAVNNRCYPGDGGPDVATCASPPPTPTCTTPPASGQACNPSCQFGCDCGWCAVVDGAAKCLTGTKGTKDIGAVCDTTLDADCLPGLFCKPECGVPALGRCYKFCAGSTAAGPSACSCGSTGMSSGPTGSPSFSFQLCNLVGQTCDPVAMTGCSADALGCYVDSSGQTSCSCKGSTALGSGCQLQSQCLPGLFCVGPAGAATCQQLCRAGGTDCAAPTPTCAGANPTYGYCQ